MKPARIVIAALFWITGGSLTAGELLVDDFADRDLEAEPGLSWIVIADEVMGGGSTARLRVVAQDSGHALELVGATGDPAAGLPIGFARGPGTGPSARPVPCSGSS